MKKIFLLLLTIFILPLGVFAQDDAEVEKPWSVGVDVASGYIWRGQLYNEGLTFQPYFSYTLSDKLTFNLWGTRNMGDTKVEGEVYQEFDLGVAYAATDWLTLNLTSYYWPTAGADETPSFTDFSVDGVQTLDFYAVADFTEMGAPINVTFSTFLLGNDFDETEKQCYSTYLEVGSSLDLPFEISATPSIGLLLSNKSGYYEANGTMTGLCHVGAKITKEFSLGSLTLPVWTFVSYNNGVVEEAQPKLNVAAGISYSF